MSAKTDDYDEIVRVIQLYLDGFDGHVDKFKEAFHEDAGFFCIGADGSLDAKKISECFEEWAGGWKISGRIVSLTQVGDAAGVVLLFGHEWVDFHSLVRVDGVWKITNKTANHVGRLVTGDAYDEIVRVIQLYLEGGRDIEKFRKAFREDAGFFCVLEDGSLDHGLASDYFEGWSKPPGWDVDGRILSVTQKGDAAGVVSLFYTTTSLDSGWIDFHNLIRVDGVWKITSKTATHSSR